MPNRLPGHGRISIDDLRDERLVVGLIVAMLVTAGVVVQTKLMNGPFGGQTVLHLLQGPIVAVYGSVLAFCVDPRRGFLPAILFVVLGVSQPAWALAVAIMGGTLFGGSNAMTTAWLYGGTGLVLGIPVCWVVWRWWSVVSMAATALISACLGALAPMTLLGVPSEGLAIAMLHLGLCYTLTAATIERTWRIVPDHGSSCPACGYPREGLRANICPECGGRLP